MHDEELEYVGFWARTGAALIDSIWELLLIVPLLAAFYGWTFFTDGHEGLAGPAEFVVSYVLPATLFIGFWFLKQATPGKMAIQSRIVDAVTGENPSLGQCVVRYVGIFLSSLPLGLGLIWVAWDKKKQGWHDKLARTVVVRAKDRRPQKVSFEKIDR